MSAEPLCEESFGPKLFSGDEPNNEWGIDQLGEYARAQHQAIVDGERMLAPLYWRLGQGLILAKSSLNRGQMGKFLWAYGISKTRAARARTIFHTFKSAEQVSGLSVEEAYEQRQRRQAKKRQKTAKPAREKGADELAAFIAEVCTKAEELIDAAGFAEKEDAGKLLPSVRDAIARLEQLRELLETQAGDQ